MDSHNRRCAFNIQCRKAFYPLCTYEFAPEEGRGEFMANEKAINLPE